MKAGRWAANASTRSARQARQRALGPVPIAEFLPSCAGVEPAGLLASARASARSEHPAAGACGQAPTIDRQRNSEWTIEGRDTKPLYCTEQRRLRPPENSQAEKSPPGKAPPNGKRYRRKVALFRAAGWSTAREHHQGHPAVDLTRQRVSHSGTSHC